MTTYKVLLVDDEEEVRNAIEQRINWEELGFEVIGKAQNGVKAMEIAEKLQPDVVITEKSVSCNYEWRWYKIS